MDNAYNVEPQDKPDRDNFPKKAWILLSIIWVLCLIPIPLTGTIALVMNFAALVMAIVVLVKGYIRCGVLQLLSVFILTPAFYFIGILLSSALIAHTLNTDNLPKQTLQKTIVEGLNNEVADIYKFAGKGSKSNIAIQDTVKRINPEISTSKPKQPPKENEQIITRYVVYTIEGGDISCSDIVEKNDILILKTKTSMEIEIHKAKILKVERYQTVGKETKKSVWNATKG